MEKFKITINGDRHRCTRCQCDSFKKVIYEVAILFTDTFELHCCDCGEVQSFDSNDWSNMRIRPYETEISSEDKYVERFTKPVIIDTEEGAEALVDAVEKSMKQEEKEKKSFKTLDEMKEYIGRVTSDEIQNAWKKAIEERKSKCQVCKRVSNVLEQNILNNELVCKDCMTDEYLLDHYTRRFWFGKKIKNMSKEECIKAIDHVEKIDQYRRVVKRYCVDRINELHEAENRKKEMRKTNLNIHEVMIYLQNAPKYTVAKTNISNNEEFVILDCDDDLVIAKKDKMHDTEYLHDLYCFRTDEAETPFDRYGQLQILNATFDIIEPEVDEWIECENLDEAIEKFNQAGVTIRFGGNNDYSYNSSAYTVDDMLIDAIANLGFHTFNRMKIEYKK